MRPNGRSTAPARPSRHASSTAGLSRGWGRAEPQASTVSAGWGAPRDATDAAATEQRAVRPPEPTYALRSSGAAEQPARGSRTSSAAHAKLAADYQRSRGQAGSSARARSQLTEGRDMNPLFQDGPSSYAAPPPPPQRVEQASPLTDRIRPASDAPQYDSGGQPVRNMTLAREHGVFGGGPEAVSAPREPEPEPEPEPKPEPPAEPDPEPELEPLQASPARRQDIILEPPRGTRAL